METNRLNELSLTEAYIVDDRFTVESYDMARITNAFYCKGAADIQVVAAIKTPNGLALSNPRIVLEVHHGN